MADWKKDSKCDYYAGVPGDFCWHCHAEMMSRVAHQVINEEVVLLNCQTGEREQVFVLCLSPQAWIIRADTRWGFSCRDREVWDKEKLAMVPVWVPAPEEEQRFYRHWRVEGKMSSIEDYPPRDFEGLCLFQEEALDIYAADWNKEHRSNRASVRFLIWAYDPDSEQSN